MLRTTDNLLSRNSDSRYVLVTDTRTVKVILDRLDANLTESDYTSIIIKAGYDTGVLILDNSPGIIEQMSGNLRLCQLAAAVESEVFELFRVLLMWTMSNNPVGAFTTFDGERLWLWWK